MTHRGYFIPPRPEKNPVEGQRASDDFVELRRSALEKYLVQLAMHPAIAQSDVSVVTLLPMHNGTCTFVNAARQSYLSLHWMLLCLVWLLLQCMPGTIIGAVHAWYGYCCCACLARFLLQCVNINLCNLKLATGAKAMWVCHVGLLCGSAMWVCRHVQLQSSTLPVMGVARIFGSMQ